MASVIAGHGHGTDDTDGVMGLSPGAKILNIRDEGLRSDGFASSIRYAVDHGASVINISQEGQEAINERAEPAAIAYALKKDVLVVAGSGNENTSAGYPASYPGVVAVGGVKSNGKIWDKSNYGPHLLLTGPGAFNVSAGGPTHTSYRSGTGTSDSTAYVSAAVALLRAKFPNLSVGQLVNRLVKTAGLPDSAKGIPLPDERYGYRYIQPLAALTRNIPAGSKYGPLTVPESLKHSSSALATTAGADDTASPSSSGAKLKHLVFLTIVGVIALLVIALVIVKIARRDKGGGNGPAGPSSPGGYASSQPPYGQQPCQQQPQDNPYMTPTTAGTTAPTHRCQEGRAR